MGILDKVVAAVTPLESDEKRMQARANARTAAVNGSWLAMALDHHDSIEQCFESVRTATSADARRAAQKQLATLLTGHSLAEEVVLYPALALNHEKSDSTKAYTEQSAAKVQLAALEEMDPMSQDYTDKLEHVRGAVLHHIYEEESEWFIDLTEKLDAAKQQHMTQRFTEEFLRYMGDDAHTLPGTGHTNSMARTQPAMGSTVIRTAPV
jgi:hypothetical protein